MTIPTFEDEPLIVEVADRVATLTFAHGSQNPIGRATIERLEAVVPELAADPEVRAVVVTGRGAHFCAGANIKEFGEIRDEGSDAFMRRRVAAIASLEALRVPVIAKIRGNALGGGLEFAMGCHLRIADTTARLGVPEIKLGILPGWGGTQRLPRLVPHDVALMMLMTGAPVSAVDALRVGLVTEVVGPDDLDGRVAELARELASGPQLAIAGALRAVYEGAGLPLAEGIDLEQRIIAVAREHPDHREGVRSFRERRPPKFE